jgi:hypothetical protein
MGGYINLIEVYLFVFHNTYTFYLPPLLTLVLSVVINIPTIRNEDCKSQF